MHGYLLCMKCLNVFQPDIWKFDGRCNLCPDVRCRGDIHPIDENMIPTIIALNRRGYITESCCSGHIWDWQHAHINFNSEIRFSKKVQKSIPISWKIIRLFDQYAIILDPYHTNLLKINHARVGCNQEMIISKMWEWNLELYEWVKRLPE